MIIPIKKIIIEEGLFSPKDTIRVYHGTSPEYKEEILKNGMNISKAGTGNTSISKLDKNIQDVSGNKNYTTTSRFQAASYAAQHKNGKRLAPDQISGLDTLKNYITGKGIVTMDIPKGFDAKHKTINPEYAENMKQAKSGFIGTLKALKAKNAFKDDRVYNKDIPTSFIKGSIPKIQDSYNITKVSKNPLKDIAVRGRTKRIRKNEKYISGVKAGLGTMGIVGTIGAGMALTNE